MIWSLKYKVEMRFAALGPIGSPFPFSLPHQAAGLGKRTPAQVSPGNPRRGASFVGNDVGWRWQMGEEKWGEKGTNKATVRLVPTPHTTLLVSSLPSLPFALSHCP